MSSLITAKVRETNAAARGHHSHEHPSPQTKGKTVFQQRTSSSGGSAAAVHPTPVREDIIKEDKLFDRRKNWASSKSTAVQSTNLPGSTTTTTTTTSYTHVKFRIGILGAARVARKHSIAIANPASSCTVSALASRDLNKGMEFIEHCCSGQSEDIIIKAGEGGYDDLVDSEGIVDAVYIPVPVDVRKEFVIRALKSGKHVLVEHPVSTTVSDYVDMINVAHECGKYLQDASMFVHHHRLEEFLQCITGEKDYGQIQSAGRQSVLHLQRKQSGKAFGEIRRIEASFTIHGDDPDMNKDIWPSRRSDDRHGCIGVLGWYCIEMGVLVFTRIGSGTVKCVQVSDVTKNEQGMPVDAKCLVKFEKDRILKFHCSFKSATRQIVKVISDERSASMVDFVFPRGVFTSYQVHEHPKSDGRDRTVESTVSVECAAGPAQEVMLWRTFARLSRGIDDAVALERLAPGKTSSIPGMGWGDSPASMEALELTSVSVQTQMIVDALMESIDNDGKEVTFFPTYEFPRV